MIHRIAQILTIAMLCLPTTSHALYTWEPIDPPIPAPTTAFTLDGERMPVNLEGFKGKAVLINFWATWCTPCIKEMPTLAGLQARYADQGLVVIAVSIDAKPFATVKHFLENQDVEHPQLAHDPEGIFYQPLRAMGVPLTYLVDRTGMLRYRFEGSTDWLQMKHAPMIQQVLQAE